MAPNEHTFHSRFRQKGRGISPQEIGDTTEHPDRKRMINKGREGGVIWEFAKKFPSGTLIVVAEVKNKTDRTLITTYWQD